MSARVGVVFPGQGSQRDGMALDFYESYERARDIFRRASEALSIDVRSICHDGDPRLNMTEYTQPCILTAEIAMLEVLKEEFGLDPELFGGHSLGEYTALVAAGAIPFETAVRLVRIRGRLMQESCPVGMGAMAAVIKEGLSYDEIDEVSGEFDVDIANENSPTQLVVSGRKEKIEAFCDEVSISHSGDEDFRVVPLNVSAPFHSRHMSSMAEEFRKHLDEAAGDLKAENAVRVVSNYTGGFHTSSKDDLIESLSKQISARVRWRENMAAIGGECEKIYEVGPGRPLRGFFKDAGYAIMSILDLRTAKRALGKE